MTLTVVIAAYDEAPTVAELLRRVRAAPTGLETDIVVVDDGSTDGTGEILAGLAGPGLRVLRHDRNRGKGAALRTAFAAARGDLVLVQDADLEYDPADYPRLLAPLLDGRADAVFGSRFLGGPHRVLYYWHALGNRRLTALCNMVSNLNLTDMEACSKAFRRDVLARLRLRSNRFGIEPELVIKTARTGCRIYEVPVSYAGRDYSEGKKIGWKDGVAAVFHILRFGLFG